MAFLNWFLSDVALPASVTAALCMAFCWIREREPQWTLLIRSTVFMRRIRAYEKARSRTPGGSAYPPDGRVPQPPSGAARPGEARPTHSTPPPAPSSQPAPSCAQAWSNQTSVGAGDSRVPAPTGPDTTGPACRTRSGSTSAPDAASSTATTGNAGCRTAKQAVTRAQRRTGHA